MAPHTKLCILHLHLHLILVILTIAIKAAPDPKPECPKNCGSLAIQYPFGTREGCYLDDSFFINCTHSIPYLPNPNSNTTVLNISLNDGELVVSSPIASLCYDNKGNHNLSSDETLTDEKLFDLTHFSVAAGRNHLTVVGCSTVGAYGGNDSVKRNSTIGVCASICNTLDEVTNGSCNDFGCCQTPVYKMLVDSLNVVVIITISVVKDFNPCSYAFIAESGAYNFSSTDLGNFENRTIPMVLNWGVGNHTCQEARQNHTNYACKAQRSECLNATKGIGYRCKCLPGFEGNPYLHDGCHDIKECHEEPNPCSGICHELEGSFNCSCPEGHEGDGRRNGTGCHHKDKSQRKLVVLIVAPCSTLLVILIGCLYLYLRKVQKEKLEKYFRQNGGILLKQQIASHQGYTEKPTIFTAKELEIATNNYDEIRVIGKGGHGTVYKGVLSHYTIVAIKKSKISSQSEIEQFINEVLVLSQIRHKNIVKLLGCCLETEVPLLVYEFITNGTLSQHIHGEGQASHQLSWSNRLRIATETAEALTYLHYATSTPIIHRDVKTANILLDDNLTAKVSDFGASKLVPMNQSQLTTLVQGTLGYLDPEYFQSSNLTEKSDVYSFGVVLAELLTGMKAVSFIRPESNRNLSVYFVSSLREGCLTMILDNNIVNDESVEQIMKVAYLAKRCLMLKGEERPTMKEVAMELERIRIVEKPSSPILSSIETESSFRVQRSPYIVDVGDDNTGSSIITNVSGIQSQTFEGR